jgi:hypothetical protein
MGIWRAAQILKEFKGKRVQTFEYKILKLSRNQKGGEPSGPV